MYIKRYKLRKILVPLAFFFACLASISAQDSDIKSIKLDELDRSAVFVTGGYPTDVPHKTSYGFICVQDSKFISCTSKSGQNLWLTNLKDKIKFYTVTKNDFTYVITQKNQLSLLYPSGLTLWTSNLDFIPTGAPLQGFEDRVYITGENTVACWSIGSEKKWKISTEKQGILKPRVLNDASLLVFMAETVGAKTKALRICPYGAVIEEIVFQGTVLNSFSTEDGVILAFSDGKIGMCSVNDKKDGIKNHMTFSKWVNNDVFCNSNTMYCKASKGMCALFTPNDRLYLIDLESGITKGSFSLPAINKNSCLSIDFIDEKFVIFDQSSCVIYSSQGKLIREFVMPSQSGKYKWLYAMFIDNGILCFFSKDWTVSAFKILSTSKENEVSTYDFFKAELNKRTKNYFIENIDYCPQKSAFSEEVLKTVKAYDYGEAEIDITSDLAAVLNERMNETKTVQSTRLEDNIFKVNYSSADIEKVLKIAPEVHSIYLQELLIEFFKTEKDKTLITSALVSFCSFPYDPTGEILLEIERLIRKTNPTDKYLLEVSIDAVYEICRFMGRPALYSKGKQILSNFFYPQYDEKTKAHARAILQKLADLNM